MAKGPKRVEIRGYQVGFGDCFLLSFVYSESDKKHLLIDFGTTKLPEIEGTGATAKPSEYMPLIARQIARDCGGSLTAVIATHRHADHINGFGTEGSTGASGEIIRQLQPKVVLQPWTEDPDAAADARTATRDSSRSPKSVVAGLASMHHIAQAVLELTDTAPAWMSPSLRNELRFLGMDNISNESAVRNLIAMGSARGSRAVWAHHGSDSGLGSVLPGVQISVLGPPDLTQSEKIRKMASRDPDEFWQLFSGLPGAFADQTVRSTGRKSKSSSPVAVPPEARWFRDRLERMTAQQLLEIVRSLDDQMNNTSLILLFETFGKKILFPGDAQLENWSYALRDSPKAKATRKLLADVDVYKVGHHGSMNATPKTLLWGNFRKRGLSDPKKRLHCMLSTLADKHGSRENNTEVPRRTLVTALQQETVLANTQQLRFGAQPELSYTVVIEP